MTEESWATFGIDLHIELGGTRLRVALETALREAIQTGRLHSGSRMPSSRALAKDLGIARNTVAHAYSQLIAEGWLTSVTGSGTRVMDRQAAGRLRAPASQQPHQAAPPRFNLRAGSPDLASFPRTAWLAASRRALHAASNGAFGYADPRGHADLRRTLADYLSRARGVRADPELIVICSGFTQGLALLCSVLRERGATTLAVEAYGHQFHRRVVAGAGLRPTAVTVDSLGAVVDEAGNAGALLVTPAHQFPLGMVLAPERRNKAVAWAQAGGGVVIEDDYDGEFRYDREPVGALQALAPDHVVYAGSVSKGLAPGLRLGWLVLPPTLIDEVRRAKRLADAQSSILDQLALAEFITSGAYDRHVRRRRMAYRRRRDRLAAALHRDAPHARLTGVAAGLHAILELPAGQSEESVVARAEDVGLALEGLQTYSGTDERHAPALVVGYGAPPDHAFTGAVARLCAVLDAAG